MATQFHDQIDRGSVYRLEFLDFDPETEAATNYGDGATAVVQLRPSIDEAAALTLTSSPAAGLTITPAQGRILMEITHPQTASLTAESYLWALELTWGGGTVERLAEGVFTMTPEVVQS